MKAISKRVLSLGLSLAMVASVIAVPSTEAQAATGIAKSKTYYAGQTKTLKLTTSSSWKSVKTTWSTSKKSIVKIAKKTNKTVTINCVKAGKANVTAKVSFKKGTKKYTKKYTCKVTVKNPKFEVSAGQTTLKLGETTAIKVTKSPASAVVKYSSDDAAIAKISGGRITATGIGTTKINARLKIGSQTVARKSVEITVIPSADGLTVSLSNPLTAEYPNTVLVNQSAIINVACVKDGKPVSGETVVLTTGTGTGKFPNYEVKDNTATTNSNGIATFVIKHKNTVSPLKASDTDEVASVNYSISVPGSTAGQSGSVDFAAVYYDKVDIRNNDDAAYPNLVPGTNYKELFGDTNRSEAYTASMDDPTTPNDEYVESQQVSSADSDEHAVYVSGGYPMIQFPDQAADLSSAMKKVEPIDVSYGPYGTYEGVETSKYVTLTEDPTKLTYAALNFDYLKLSNYTKARIATYVSEDAAKADTTNSGGMNPKYFEHEQNQGAFSYQIPLEKNAKCVKITIYSKGQVNTAMNGGYKASSIEYVYKTGANISSTPLRGADVTWSIVDSQYTDEAVLVAPVAGNLTKTIGGCDIDLKKDEKITYKLPRFPYTGTAILTHYDANGKVVSYYAYSTVNNGVNQNVLGQPIYGHDYDVRQVDGVEIAFNKLSDVDKFGNFNDNGRCYKITADELRDKVGTIVSQDGKTAKVNSYQSGRTTLEGKVTVNGKVIEALDSETDTMYTSIQWNPIPMQTAKSAAFVAFVGQNIEVTAQLIDKNGNAVTKDKQNVTFYYTENKKEKAVEKTTTSITATDNDNKTLPKVSVVKVDTETDSKGQAKLILKASDITAITDIKAKSVSSEYEVREIIADKNITSADLYWVEPELVFEDCAVTRCATDLVKVSTDSTHTNVTATGNMNPLSGGTWLYGVKSEANKLPNIGALARQSVQIDGLNITMAKSAGGVGTVEATSKMGEVKATSIKTGKTTIVSKITSASVTADTKIVTGNATFAGTGTAAIGRTLKLEVEWKNNGKTAEMLAPNGTNIVSGNTAPVYVKVTDSNGNPVEDGTNVTLTSDDANSTFTGGAVSTNAVTVDGIAKTRLTMGADRVTVTATVDGISDQTYTVTYTRVNPTENIAVDDKQDDLTEKFKATFDKATGVITLVFTKDILESSVVTSGIAAFYDDVNMGVDSVSVNGNVLTIKVVNVPGTIDASKDITVRFRTATIKGVDYTLTSENGTQFVDKNVSFKVDGGNTKPVAKTCTTAIDAPFAAIDARQ